jgi:predicted permease
MTDFKFAFRSLRKTPGFTLVAILTMAVAIGACASLFSVLQAVVLRPLAYPNPHELVSIWAINTERNLKAPAVSWAKFEGFNERKDVFKAISMSTGNTFTLIEGVGDPEQVAGVQASANFLPVLGLSPLLGRHFTAEEDSEGSAQVAMISYQLWQTRFSGAPDIVGRVIQIDGIAREVVGVLPQRMPAPFTGIGILVPRPLDLAFIAGAQRHNVIIHQAIARLADGMTAESANLRLQEMVAQFKAANPTHIDAGNRNEIRTLYQQVVGDLQPTFWTLSAAVAAVLLIACANIANLFLARVSSRQKEIAVRMSLGAERGEIVRQFLAESLLFSLAAGALGVLLAGWSLQAIQLLAGQQIPRVDEISLDPTVLIFSAGVAVISGLLIGVYPALQGSRTDVQMVLKDSARGAGGGATAKAFRNLLVVAQVAMSLTLLICAGLLVASFHRLQHNEMGFTTEGGAYGVVNLPANRYGKPEISREFFRQLQDRLRAAPELASGAAINALPLSGNGIISPYGIKGRPLPPVHDRPLFNIRQVTTDYFETLGIKLADGRFFTDDDRFGNEAVAMINESFAKKIFPNESAIDQAFLIGPTGETVVRIVGVIKDVKSAGLAEAVPDEAYFPRDQRGGSFMSVIGRAQPGLSASTVIPALRRILHELDPNVALATPRTLDELVAQSISVQRVTMALLIAFAAIAALLAAVGVYSVMAYSVAQRTGEIGVRMALGASTGNILGLIMKAGAVQVGAGLLIGLVAAGVASKSMERILYEIKPFDLGIFAAVCAAFTVVAALACYFPARRATRVDPMEALRTE